MLSAEDYFLDLPRYDKDPSDKDIIHYLAIGSARSARQQYPYFFKKLENTSIRLILIDELLDKPPYIIQELGDEYETVYENYFYYPSLDIEVIFFPSNKIIEYDQIKYMYDDKSMIYFKLYNNYCKTNDILLFVHDFSGMDIIKLAYYFDDILKKKGLDKRVMYCINNRKRLNCNIESDPTCAPIFYKVDNKLRVFNPYMYSNEELAEIYPISSNHHKAQIGMVIKNQNNYILTLCSLYRRYFLMEKGEDICIKDHELSLIGLEWIQESDDVSKIRSRLGKEIINNYASVVSFYPIHPERKSYVIDTMRSFVNNIYQESNKQLACELVPTVREDLDNLYFTCLNRYQSYS